MASLYKDLPYRLKTHEINIDHNKKSQDNSFLICIKYNIMEIKRKFNENMDACN